MKLSKDYFKRLIVPDYVLTKANQERIGILKCTEKILDTKFKAPDEITFKTYLNIDDTKNPYYEAIDIMKYILLPNIGFFSISSCDIHSEGTDFEHKSVTAKSYECLLGQKYLENFVINMGTVESIDGVYLYSVTDKTHSLLHLVLEKCPEWKIGHIDTILISMQRSFEIDRQDIYSFLMNDVSIAFQCVFIFDTLNMTINVYHEDNIGKDTNTHVSYNNLLKSTDLSCNIDDIKTCLTVVGAEELSIREVNMSQDKIYNFDYYNSTDYMSESLYSSYNAWIDLYNDSLKQYTPLLSSYQDYYIQINYLTNKKMPNDPKSTNWEEYGLEPLRTKLSAYEQEHYVMMIKGWGEETNKYYSNKYLPVYNTIQDIKKQIKVVESDLKNLEEEQSKVYSQMKAIIDSVSMDNNFSKEELEELSAFIREDEVTSDNYVVTDTMSDEERFKMLDEMLEYGQKELQKKATPQLSFSIDMANIFAIPEFDSLLEDFDIANYIWVSIRDDYHIKVRLLEIHMNFYDMDDFKVSFGNILRKKKNRYSDTADILKQVQSMATSVSFNKSSWSQASKDATDINKMLAEGLLAQGNYITNNPADSEFLIDKRGIFVNTISGDYAYKDSIYLGGGRMLFTDDAWKTVAMAVGRADINGESRFGVFADFCIASYIAGSTMEGGTITGTVFNNGSGTFKVDENGHMIAKSGEFTGDITASTITGTSINNGNGTFSVDKNGNVVATSGDIGGAKISSNSIKASNGNWSINSNGSALFKNVTISGNSSGSFGNGFSADNSFGLTGGALVNFNDLVANKVTANYIDATVQLSAKYATITSLDAVSARVKTIESDYIKTAQLNATNAAIDNIKATYATVDSVRATYATIDNLNVTNLNVSNLNNVVAGKVDTTYLQANYLTASSIKSDYMEVANWVSAGHIKAERIDGSTLSITNGATIGGFVIKNSSILSTDFGIRDSDSRSIGMSLSVSGNMFEAMKGTTGLSVNANGVIYVNNTYTLASYIENIAYQQLKSEGLV